MPDPLRGQVYWYDLRPYGRKPFLVISPNERNRRLDTVIAARVTSTQRDLPTWVRLTDADPLPGSNVNCDDIEQVYKDELLENLGACTRATMRRVNQTLALALDLLRD
jgi:mRNA interferase MazF